MGAIALSATANGGGALDATGATLTVDRDWAGIWLASNGDVTLDSTTLATDRGAAEVDLGTAEATLSVNGTVVEDDDGTLPYAPSGVSERPGREDVRPA